MASLKYTLPRSVRRLAWCLTIAFVIYLSGLRLFNVTQLNEYEIFIHNTNKNNNNNIVIDDLQKSRFNRHDVIAQFIENKNLDHSVISEARTFLDKPRIFFYNRAPKCGSRSVLEVFKHIKGLQKLHCSIVAHHYLNKSEQEDVVHKLQVEPPALYDRHVPMINFTKFGAPFPIYINVVREPLSHFISHFNYRRNGSLSTKKKLEKGLLNADELKRIRMDMDTCVQKDSTECGVVDKTTGTKWIRKNIPFFIGQEVHLSMTTSAHLALAKQNARRYYAVVGIVEDLETFFETLGFMFPDVFEDAAKIYNRIALPMMKATKTKLRQNVTQGTLDTIRYRLRFEYDFYYFLRSRIYTLYAQFKKFGKL